MGSLFGTTTNPTASSPIVGGGTQQQFFNSLFNMGLTQTGEGMQNGVPTTKFAAMPSYQGQLTPDLSQMMASQVWGGWKPEAPGQAQAKALGENAQFNINPGYNWQNGLTAQGSPQSGPLSFLSQYMGGGNQVAMPMPNYNFNASGPSMMQSRQPQINPLQMLMMGGAH